MKQFNLEEYIKYPQKKIITRRGNEVRIICTDRNITYNDIIYPIVALVKYPERNNIEQVIYYTVEGRVDELDSELDLFFNSERKEGWINIYKYNSKITPGSQVYNTKEKAELSKGADLGSYISTIKIEWKE